MSFIIATQTELLKTKRTSSFWLSILGAAFIPTVYCLLFLLNSDETIQDMGPKPWAVYLERAWQILCVFILPIYIILLSTLVTQIEFKNNTWKQVFASPQSFGIIYFSKFLAIHLLILFCFLMFNALILLVGVMASQVNPKFAFLENAVDWEMILKLNLKTYISILSISAIQYWLSLRFKNFIAPVGIGLALCIGSIVAFGFQWAHMDKYPYCFPALSIKAIQNPGRPLFENHELNSIGYFLFFSLLGFLDLRMRKAKG
jgi:hypothetical protein